MEVFVRYFMHVSALLLFLVSTMAAQDRFEDMLVGTWINADSGTGGLTRIVIGRSGSELQIHAWGKCHPQDCDWGTVQLDLIGDNIRDESPSQAMATWNHRFAITHLLIGIEGRRMVIRSYTLYRDASGRRNQRALELFVKR